MEKNFVKSEQRRLKEKNEWEAREHRYKEKVRQLNLEPTGVPIGLFKLVKDESEGRKLEIRKLREKTSELESTLLLMDAQAKANMSQTRSKTYQTHSDLPAPSSQRVPPVKTAISEAHKTKSLTKPSQQLSVSHSHNADRSALSSALRTTIKKDLAIQTRSPRDFTGLEHHRSKVAPSRPPVYEHIEVVVSGADNIQIAAIPIRRDPEPSATIRAPSRPPARELVDVVFSGTQLTPRGSKMIKIATIPTRKHPEPSLTINRAKCSNVLPEKGALDEAQRRVAGTINSQTISGQDSKENLENKVIFSFPTPDEKKGQTGRHLRMKMVREAGGRKGILEKLEKIRSPRSLYL